MRSIPLAMTWELFRHGRWSLTIAALGATGISAALMAALWHDGAIDPTEPSQMAICLWLVQINMFIFGAAVLGAQGAPSRLFALPVPTSSLVAWHMLTAMTLVGLEILASTALLNITFELGWPLWGPAIFAAVAIAIVQAALWLTDKSAWMPWAFGIAGAVSGLWYKSRHGAVFSLPTRLWHDVTLGEAATMLAAGVGAYVVGVAAVARNRRGDPPPSLGIIAWLERTLDSTSDLGLPFRTPAHAQSWFEWRRKGGAMPAGVVFGLLVFFVAWLIFDRDATDLFFGLVAGGWCLSLLGMPVGILVGSTGPNDTNFEMGNFLATRPFTSTDLSRTILKMAAKSVFLGWSIWVVAIVTLYAVLMALRVDPGSLLPDPLNWWYFPATLLGPWIVVMSLASVLLTGRSRPFVGLLCTLCALLVVMPLVAKFALSHQARVNLEYGCLTACGVVFGLGTAWMFGAARRRALIGSPIVYAASSIWVTLSTLVVLDWFLHPAAPIAVYVLVVGLAAGVVAPLATAPLAIAWNRTR